MFKRSTPLSGDTLVYYTQKELYDLYVREGRSHHEAFALSQELHRHLRNMNQRERRMWLRSLRDRGIYTPEANLKEVV